jgi:uncharacterized protein YyaL (SSP411 family)
MANRLKTATSPYLLQHADNPVDWWPWGEEAFVEARRRDVPVLLSVGYAACHWCHVMAHESFEDPATAAIVNDNVVAIKVDREERPDVDAVYMAATQAMTGQGGWPMTVFTTPDGAPLYCGTYFPREPFGRLVEAVHRAWRADKQRLISDAQRNVAALTEQASALSGLAGEHSGEHGGEHAGAGAGGLSAADLAAVTSVAVRGLQAGFDSATGGFGQAPKFPPSMVLEFLLRHHQRTGSPQALRMAVTTCEAMASGGMYDQLGGGFARYSVDGTWTVPHFEKMLYDNALLARAYTHWWRISSSPLARRVAEETCDFMLRELLTAEGGLSASLDADSADASGHSAEGAFYVWTPAELREVLGEADATFAAQAFGVTTRGTFEHGTSVLQRRSPAAEPAEPVAADTERLDRIRGTLLAFREGRSRPARDDKVVAAWNGMAIGALAEAGVLFDRPDFVRAASAIAQLLTSLHLAAPAGQLPPAAPTSPDPASPAVPPPAPANLSSSQTASPSPVTPSTPAAVRLLRTSRNGAPGASAGLLEDYACVAAGLLTLYGVTGEARWVPVAGGLLETVLGSFADGSGGFYDAPADGERLIFRPADPLDGATPSGAFAAADALLAYASLTCSARHRDAALAALGVLPAVAGKYPRACGLGLAVAEALLAGPVEIAITGPCDDPRTGDLLRAALHAAPSGSVLALGDGTLESAPLLAGRGLAGGAPTAYVCRGFTCRLPVTTPADLREELAAAGNNG